MEMGWLDGMDDWEKRNCEGEEVVIYPERGNSTYSPRRGHETKGPMTHVHKRLAANDIDRSNSGILGRDSHNDS